MSVSDKINIAVFYFISFTYIYSATLTGRWCCVCQPCQHITTIKASVVWRLQTSPNLLYYLIYTILIWTILKWWFICRISLHSQKHTHTHFILHRNITKYIMKNQEFLFPSLKRVLGWKSTFHNEAHFPWNQIGFDHDHHKQNNSHMSHLLAFRFPIISTTVLGLSYRFLHSHFLLSISIYWNHTFN